MWTTVLLLAVAVNLEPTRIALLPVLLARRRPLAQLLAYLAGSLTVSLAFGLAVLFVFHRSPLGVGAAAAGRAQLVIGVIALAAAAVLLLRWAVRRGDGAASEPTRVSGVAATVRAVLARGRSPWFAGLVGIGVGLPSPDYLAVLVVIVTSGTPPAEQAAALVTFIVVCSLVVLAPLVGYLLAPARTLDLLDRFGNWTRSRSLIEYAALLALLGLMLIAIGWARL